MLFTVRTLDCPDASSRLLSIDSHFHPILFLVPKFEEVPLSSSHETHEQAGLQWSQMCSVGNKITLIQYEPKVSLNLWLPCRRLPLSGQQSRWGSFSAVLFILSPNVADFRLWCGCEPWQTPDDWPASPPAERRDWLTPSPSRGGRAECVQWHRSVGYFAWNILKLLW